MSSCTDEDLRFGIAANVHVALHQILDEAHGSIRDEFRPASVPVCMQLASFDDDERANSTLQMRVRRLIYKKQQRQQKENHQNAVVASCSSETAEKKSSNAPPNVSGDARDSAEKATASSSNTKKKDDTTADTAVDVIRYQLAATASMTLQDLSKIPTTASPPSIPACMKILGWFSDEESRNPTMQMRVRRLIKKFVKEKKAKKEAERQKELEKQATKTAVKEEEEDELPPYDRERAYRIAQAAEMYVAHQQQGRPGRHFFLYGNISRPSIAAYLQMVGLPSNRSLQRRVRCKVQKLKLELASRSDARIAAAAEVYLALQDLAQSQAFAQVVHNVSDGQLPTTTTTKKTPKIKSPKIPYCMRLVYFSDHESRNQTIQMRVRRLVPKKKKQKLQQPPTHDHLVPAFCQSDRRYQVAANLLDAFKTLHATKPWAYKVPFISKCMQLAHFNEQECKNATFQMRVRRLQQLPQRKKQLPWTQQFTYNPVTATVEQGTGTNNVAAAAAAAATTGATAMTAAVPPHQQQQEQSEPTTGETPHGTTDAAAQVLVSLSASSCQTNKQNKKNGQDDAINSNTTAMIPEEDGVAPSCGATQIRKEQTGTISGGGSHNTTVTL